MLKRERWDSPPLAGGVRACPVLDTGGGVRGNKATPSPAKTKALLRKAKFLRPLPQGERNSLRLRVCYKKKRGISLFLRYGRLLIFAVVILASAPSHAAPFCALLPAGKKCLYYDMKSCRRAAGANGKCDINHNEVGLSDDQKGAKFCAVSSSFGVQCFYHDAASCRRAAERAGGACLIRENNALRLLADEAP